MIRETKRVGIITLDGYHNYGNRLQNYALQEVIKELGFFPDTLIVPRKISVPPREYESIARKMIKNSTLPAQEILKRAMLKLFMINGIKKTLKKSLYKNTAERRTQKFKWFSENFLSERVCSTSNEALEQIGRDYEFFITGSDQVWNPYYITGAEHAFFLAFAEPKKRISYAASFGITQLPEPFKRMIQPWLCSMKGISVREDAGADIVKKLTGRDAVVSLDPTMLLSKDKWLDIAREAPKPDKKYLLLYFLGGKTPKTTRLIEGTSRKFNLETVDLNDPRITRTYESGPQEFIDYIHSAEAVFTDSFHGTAFSILMGTPFVVNKRAGSMQMYSRIETLLGMLDLKDREIRNIRDPKDVFKANHSRALSLLKGEQKKAYDYLEKALNLRT